MEIDYEKEYTEALERAKRLRDSKYQTMNAKRVAEEIFPVLAESEDEQIRKELIAILKKSYNSGITLNNKKDLDRYLAYLEKQKEPENVSATTMAPSCWAEKQKDQKPAGCADDVVEEAEEYASKVSCGKYGVEVTEAYIAGVLSERNRGTEWSEEDEKMMSDIIDIIKSDSPWSLEEEAEHIDWLKSLRPPLKDKEMKLKILKYLSTRCSSLEFEEVENYLNNLRPSWKPSEEQMEALHTAVYLEEMQFYGGLKDKLRELYEQLKKL